MSSTSSHLFPVHCGIDGAKPNVSKRHRDARLEDFQGPELARSSGTDVRVSTGVEQPWSVGEGRQYSRLPRVLLSGRPVPSRNRRAAETRLGGTNSKRDWPRTTKEMGQMQTMEDSGANRVVVGQEMHRRKMMLAETRGRMAKLPGCGLRIGSV